MYMNDIPNVLLLLYFVMLVICYSQGRHRDVHLCVYSWTLAGMLGTVRSIFGVEDFKIFVIRIVLFVLVAILASWLGSLRKTHAQARVTTGFAVPDHWPASGFHAAE